MKKINLLCRPIFDGSLFFLFCLIITIKADHADSFLGAFILHAISWYYLWILWHWSEISCRMCLLSMHSTVCNVCKHLKTLNTTYNYSPYINAGFFTRVINYPLLTKRERFFFTIVVYFILTYYPNPPHFLVSVSTVECIKLAQST